MIYRITIWEMKTHYNQHTLVFLKTQGRSKRKKMTQKWIMQMRILRFDHLRLRINPCSSVIRRVSAYVSVCLS